MAFSRKTLPEVSGDRSFEIALEAASGALQPGALEPPGGGRAFGRRQHCPYNTDVPHARGSSIRTVELGRTGPRVSEVGFGGIPVQRLPHEQAAAVVRGCPDESLRRLGVSRIDLYQLHGVSDEEGWQQVTSPGGALEGLRAAQKQGLIARIGVTSHQVDIAKKAVRSGLFETIMFPLGFVAREPGLEVLEACREEGVGFLAMKPMGGGMLEDARLTFGSLRQYAYAIPVVGIERVAEMAEIVGLYERPAAVSAAERREMEHIQQELGSSLCRRGREVPGIPAAFGFGARRTQARSARGGDGSVMEACMRCRQLGRTGIAVSEVGYGGWGPIDDAEALRALRRDFDQARVMPSEQGAVPTGTQPAQRGIASPRARALRLQGGCGGPPPMIVGLCYGDASLRGQGPPVTCVPQVGLIGRSEGCPMG